MKISVRDPHDPEELARRIVREPNAQQRDRYRAVREALAGRPASRIAAKLDRGQTFVQKWAYAYRDGGIEAIAAKRQPGAPTKLQPDRQAAFMQRIDAGPTDADGGVCTLRGKDVVRILGQEFGACYGLQGAYDLLHRLGYACLTPRPKHRKNDPEAMAVWRRDAPLLSKRSKSNSPRKRSRCGSKMKPDSVSRAGSRKSGH